jgi:hypothetical protein
MLIFNGRNIIELTGMGRIVLADHNLRGGNPVSVITTIQFPVSYEEFQELNKKVNPENLIPPGCLSHVVFQSETGLACTDVWEDEAKGTAFYEGASTAAGMPFPAIVFSNVYDYYI